MKRDTVPPGLDDAQITTDLCPFKGDGKRWASVETLDLQGSSSRRFDNVELNGTPSHIFTIRYEKDVSIENYIEFDGDHFEILATQNPDHRKQYLELFPSHDHTKSIGQTFSDTHRCIIY